MHEQLFTFALDAGHELVGLRAVVLGPAEAVHRRATCGDGGADPSARGDRSAAASMSASGWREATDL